jgi:hypothetical protein
MEVNRYSKLVGTCLAAAVMAACSSGGSGGAVPPGSLSVALMDAPVDGITELQIELLGLRAKPQGSGPALEFPFETPLQVDLLTLTPANAALLLDRQPLPAGPYNWLELDVNADFDGDYSSFATTTGGGTHEVRVPSGTVRLVSGFTVTSNLETSFLIDWNVRMGLVQPPGQQGYLLRPAFRIIDMTEFGTLTGTVAAETLNHPSCSDDAALGIGNVVYIYDGHDVEPLDISGVGGDPVATVDVKYDAESGTYAYWAILTPGDYTVAFTCQASDDDPEAPDDIEFISPTNLTIVADGEETIDF